MWWESIGNPYVSPTLPLKRSNSTRRKERYSLRLLRFVYRRGLVLVCSIAAIAVIDQARLSTVSDDVFRLLHAACVSFLFANEFRLTWILSKKTALRPVDWSYHWEFAASFVAVGLRVGALYACMCTSLSGETTLKDYIEFAAIFGAPLLIAAVFMLVRRTSIAVTLSALFITALWAVYPWYTEWIH